MALAERLARSEYGRAVCCGKGQTPEAGGGLAWKTLPSTLPRTVRSLASSVANRAARAYIAGMADKPDPENRDDGYSEEETARRRDQTIRAMIGMGPQPRSGPSSIKKPAKGRKTRVRARPKPA